MTSTHETRGKGRQLQQEYMADERRVSLGTVLSPKMIQEDSYDKLIEEDDSPVETFSEEMNINVILATCGRRPMRLMGSSN